jgi:uncharacterized protein (DUF849 family)
MRAIPADGSPSPKAEDFMAFLPRIKQACDAVINVSTGGSATMSLDQRLEGAKAARPEVCSLNMGPLIFDFSGAGKRVEHWQHAWEREYVESSRGRIMYNDNVFIERIMLEVGREFGTRFEFECYDIGHLYTLAHFAERKLVEPPFLIQGVFGILGGIGADVRNLAHMVTIADSLFGDDYLFSAFAAGRTSSSSAPSRRCSAATSASGSRTACSSARASWRVERRAGRPRSARCSKPSAARSPTPAEARAMLALKGGDNVGF